MGKHMSALPDAGPRKKPKLPHRTSAQMVCHCQQHEHGAMGPWLLSHTQSLSAYAGKLCAAVWPVWSLPRSMPEHAMYDAHREPCRRTFNVLSWGLTACHLQVGGESSLPAPPQPVTSEPQYAAALTRPSLAAWLLGACLSQHQIPRGQAVHRIRS